MKFFKLNILFFGCCFLLFISCATYQTRSIDIKRTLQSGNYGAALEQIDKNKFLSKPRNKLLYFFEKGKIAHLNRDYKLSNELLNKADYFIESNKKAFGNQIIGMLLNPEKETYKGEDFEKVAIHYYKALNYLFLNQYDEALVEAKRINFQIHSLNEKYPAGKKNRYNNDAFAHMLQGLLYEVLADVNNAFIAYRNAVDLYLENNESFFGVHVPSQLIKDLFRTASIMGFEGEILRYEKLLHTNYVPEKVSDYGEAIVFWENGLVPFKEEVFYGFTILPGNRAGYVTIINKELNLDFVLPISTGGNGKSEFSDLDIFNVSFPKYIPQSSIFQSASVMANSQKYFLEPIENFETIAMRTLKDRTLREIGKTAARLATKKISEYTLKNQNADLGTVLGIFNAFTEGADTRNWQSLPQQIFYSRIPLKKGENKIL